MTAPTDRDLQDGFASFVDAARRLEESYSALKLRAAEIDVQLARANAQLEATLQEREAVFAALPVGVVALDAAKELRFCNPEGERVVDIASESGTDVLQLDAGKHEIAELTVRVTRVDLPDGGTLVVLEDRSRLAHLEREVDRLDRMAGLSELALGVAHEIKNPLNGVMGFASLMERHEDPDQIRRCARKISAGMHEVDTIVKAMLAFARPAGKGCAPRSVRDVVASAASEASVPTSRLTVEGDVRHCADGPTLTRVMANLLRNSLEAGASSIEVVARAEAGEITIDVRDDGPGIDGEVGARLFEPFVSSKDRGHGLGLALAARVLSFLGGRIELVEGDHPGAHFRVRVPEIPVVETSHLAEASIDG